jgi:single-strand DNA-binding protein
VANQYLSKGKQVYIEGRLRQQDYTDRDGNRRTSLEVTASDIQFIGTKGEESSGLPTAAKPARPPATDIHDEPPVNDDEIPF